MSQHINTDKHDDYAIITMAKEPVNRWVAGNCAAAAGATAACMVLGTVA
jgi:hypothetical protein